MTASIDHDRDMLFAPESQEDSDTDRSLAPWKLLVVDDEDGVHQATRLALSGFEFDGRRLQFLDAYSAAEGEQIMLEQTDVAVVLVDVVMEREHAGLDLIRLIRGQHKNKMVRLILRTGQPGQAPERSVIHDYDINDYKEKSELSAGKLYSTVLTSLRSYRDLAALEANRVGLRRVIQATGEIFRTRRLDSFVQGVLEQLVSALFLERDSMVINCDSIALEKKAGRVVVVAATGRFANLVGVDDLANLGSDLRDDVSAVLTSKSPRSHNGEYWGYFRAHNGREDVIYLKSRHTLTDDDLDLIQLFLQNVAIAYENTILHEEIEGTQRDIVYMLGEAIESRSRETGQHVRRVAEYCYAIAKGLGLSDRDSEILRIAAPLHDFGKIGVPDAILHKPGRLDADEWKIMRQHAEIGREMLGKSEREILRAAAMLAGHHHEKWDGSGYPQGLKGQEIHIFGRIGAVADVFDALGTRRSYKEPWPVERILGYLNEQRGQHFDPDILDWVMANVDSMSAVAARFPD